MAFVDKKFDNIKKLDYKSENYIQSNLFENINNNDTWIYNKLLMGVRHGKKKHPNSTLYGNIIKENISKIIGSANFINYNDTTYDIWVVKHSGNVFLIRSSERETILNIKVSKKDTHNFQTNKEIGEHIHSFMIDLVYITNNDKFNH